jgi:hypothetical protein
LLSLGDTADAAWVNSHNSRCGRFNSSRGAKKFAVYATGIDLQAINLARHFGAIERRKSGKLQKFAVTWE